MRTDPLKHVVDRLDAAVVEYTGREPPDRVPVVGYAALLGAYAAGATVMLGSAIALRGAPDRVATRDIVLFGVATHKLTRVLTRDRIGIPLRAPFTRFEGSAGAGEVKESSRGRGLRRAIGQLVSCQFCADQWVGTALFTGFIVAPRLTRLVAALFASVAVADFAHQAYAAARGLSAKPPEQPPMRGPLLRAQAR